MQFEACKVPCCPRKAEKQSPDPEDSFLRGFLGHYSIHVGGSTTWLQYKLMLPVL